MLVNVSRVHILNPLNTCKLPCMLRHMLHHSPTKGEVSCPLRKKESELEGSTVICLDFPSVCKGQQGIKSRP